MQSIRSKKTPRHSSFLLIGGLLGSSFLLPACSDGETFIDPDGETPSLPSGGAGNTKDPDPTPSPGGGKKPDGAGGSPIDNSGGSGGTGGSDNSGGSNSGGSGGTGGSDNSGGTGGSPQEPETPDEEDLKPLFSSLSSPTFAANVFDVVALRDRSYAFVSLSFSTIEGHPGAAIGVLQPNQEKKTWELLHYISVYSEDQQGKAAFGLALTPDESILSVALNNKGVGLLDVEAAIQGDATPFYLRLYTGFGSSGPGALHVLPLPDQKHLFVVNEYGRSEDVSGIGDVAIVSYEKSGYNQLSAQRLGYIKPGQNSIAGSTLSPDGKTLYIPSQVALSPATFNEFKGQAHPEVWRSCGLNANQVEIFAGSITVVDVETVVAAAQANPGNRVFSEGVLHQVASGCNSVRLTASQDGKTLWSSARGTSQIHVFDAEALRENPDAAYLHSFSSEGDAPVGLAVFSQDRFLVVSNSNRFTPDQGSASIALFDVSERGAPRFLQTIESGLFPRDIWVHPDQSSVFVANWNSGNFQEITLSFVP